MKKKKIAFFTASRAEFGILSPFIRKVLKQKEFEGLLFVGGAHLSKDFGFTVKEIKQNGFKIDGTFDYIPKKNTSNFLSRSVGRATIQISNIFKKNKFDFVCVLGDRYELLSVITNCILFKKPIIHIAGGEEASGSIDQQIRHMITKAAHLHFASCEEHKKNIIRMGEFAWRTHNVGSLSIDNINFINKYNKAFIYKTMGLNDLLPTVLMTYHPTTLEFKLTLKEQINNIFYALNKFNFQLVVTLPNSDVGRDEITALIKKEVAKKKNYHYFKSLGFEMYHNLLKYCQFVIGNSSSGIIEVPYYKIATINIGNRQLGRIRHASIIDTDYSKQSILKAIKKTFSSSFNKQLPKMRYKFGNGQAANKILSILKKTNINQKLMTKNSNFI